MATVIRTWARLYENTRTLAPKSLRGKHSKFRCLLVDEDVKAQRLAFFRALPPNSGTATKLQYHYRQVVFPSVIGKIGPASISLTTVIKYLDKWEFLLHHHTQIFIMMGMKEKMSSNIANGGAKG
ncbi:hypothetical protein V1520DRAFT_350521 [Lipomyces starkeyi]